MAVAGWLLGGKICRYGQRRNNHSRQEKDGDYVYMDFNLDPADNMCEILTNLTKSEGISEGRRLSYLNAFIRLVTKPDVNYDDLGYTAEEILYCLRPLSFHESTQLKNSSFRAVRHFIRTEEHVELLIKLKYDFLIARQITAAGIQLCRRVVFINPDMLTLAPVQAMVALVHPTHSDRLQASALAFLVQLAVVNPNLLILCGGVSALMKSIPYVKPAMAEAILAPLLFLLNNPSTREKAGINLQCLTDPVFMDKSLHPKNTVPNNGLVRFNTTSIVCLLRSWPGLLHLAQGDQRAISSIVNTLYNTQLQREMLGALYQLFGLNPPEWTDEISVALECVDPSCWQPSFSLSEGFIAVEALSTYPHLATTRLNVVETHLALVLRTLVQCNLLDAIVHVVVSEDSFLSVHATILLGEILNLVDMWLPAEVTKLLPGLPNLISYAVRGRPLSRHHTESDYSASLFHDTQKLAEGWCMTNLVDAFSRRFSLDSKQSLVSDSGSKQGKAQSVLTTLALMSRMRYTDVKPSVYLAHLRSTIHHQSYVIPTLSASIDECIKDSGVLTQKDPLTWNWDAVQAFLKIGSCSQLGLLRTLDATKRSVIRRLANFYLPRVGKFSQVVSASDRKSNSKLTLALLDLVSLLLALYTDMEMSRIVMEILSCVKSCIVEILSSKSAHDCFMSPSACTNSRTRDYFLMIGRFTCSERGRQALVAASLYTVLTDLLTSTNQDCYIKLTVSCLDYASDENSRKLLTKVIESKSVYGRMYVAKLLHAMLRMSLSGAIMEFVIYHLVLLLDDEDKQVSSYAIGALHEACASKVYLECLVRQAPSLVRHGDQGVLLLVRCLSTTKGYNSLKQANFVTNQLTKWSNHYNFRYEVVVDNLLSEWIINCRKGRHTERNYFLPPHLYQMLACHKQGLAVLMADAHIHQLVERVKEGKCQNESEVVELKVALYALSGIAVHLDSALVPAIIRLSTSSPYYQVRGAAYVALNNIATSRQGADILATHGWCSVRRDRQNITPKFNSPGHLKNPTLDESSASSLNRSGGDVQERIEEMDVVEEEEIECFFWALPGKTERVREGKCLTLPHCGSSLGVGHYGGYVHNRSYSESKADDSTMSRGRKSRSNSYTGTSEGKSRHYSFSGVERSCTLSPIQSFGSVRNSGLWKHLQMKRSAESVLKSLPQPSIFPEGITTYAELNSPQQPTSLEESVSFKPEDADFSLIDNETSSDFQEFSYSKSDSPDNQGGADHGVVESVFCGIAMPETLASLFPPVDPQTTAKHVAFKASNLHTQGFEDLKNPWFHTEICFLGSNGVHNTMVSTSETEGGQYIPDGGGSELEKEPLRDGESNDSSITDVPNIVEHPMPIIFKSSVIIRSEIGRLVEQLSNPLLQKNCKQSLLQIKQAHPDLLEDLCVQSDVWYILSVNQVKIWCRDFIHELFQSKCPQIWTDVHNYFQLINVKRKKKSLHKTN